MKSRNTEDQSDHLYAETVFRTIFTFDGKIKDVFQSYLHELRITEKDLLEV